MSTEKRHRRGGKKHKKVHQERRVDERVDAVREPSYQERRAQERFDSMRELAYSGAPLELLWAIQQNQLRQHQIAFCNQQGGATQQADVERLGRAVTEADQAIHAMAARSGHTGLADHFCRAPYTLEATRYLTTLLQDAQRRY